MFDNEQNELELYSRDDEEIYYRELLVENCPTE